MEFAVATLERMGEVSLWSTEVEYFEEMKAAAKDREELTKKKDFPDAAQ